MPDDLIKNMQIGRGVKPVIESAKLPLMTDRAVRPRLIEGKQVLMVGKGSPFKTPQDFVAAGKSKALKWGTTHVGSVDHIGSVAVARAAKHQNPTIVPFRGGGDIVINLVGGNIDCALVNYAEAESQVNWVAPTGLERRADTNVKFGYYDGIPKDELPDTNPENFLYRQLALVWGVHPIQTKDASDIDDMAFRACKFAVRAGYATVGERVVVVAGLPFGTPGATNMVRIAFVNQDHAAQA